MGAQEHWQQRPPWPELLRSTVSSARKAAAALDTSVHMGKVPKILCSGPLHAEFGQGQVGKPSCCLCSVSWPSWEAAKPSGSLCPRHSSHLLLLSQGTSWLLEELSQRVLVPSRLPQPLFSKTANMGPWCSLFSGRKISSRLYFPVYCIHHHHVPRWKTAV